MPSGGILALVTLPKHAVAFISPGPHCDLAPSSRTPQAPPRHQSELYSCSPISLGTIVENPASFPNTSRILRALSQDNSAGDCREFLTALSVELIQHSGSSSVEDYSEEKNWIDRNVAPSSKRTATVVGTASSYATMQGLDYVHHHEYSLAENSPASEYGAQRFASAARDPYGQEQYASAVADSSNHYADYSTTEGYEPHPYIMSPDYHYGESSPNLLRDLAKSLPPPEDYSDAASNRYDGYTPYYNENLHFVAGQEMNVVANNVQGVSELAGSAPTFEVQNAAADPTRSFSSQLSDIAYSQSFDHAETVSQQFSIPHVSRVPAMESPFANEAVSKIKEFAAHSTESINHALAQAKELGSTQFHHLFRPVARSFDGLSEKLTTVGSPGAGSFSKLLSSEMPHVRIPSVDTSKLTSLDVSNMPMVDVSKVKMPPIPQMPSVDMSKVKVQPMPSLSRAKSTITPAESLAVDANKAASSAHVNLADNSLSDIGESILGGIKYVGSHLFQFLDWVIAAVAGTSLSQVLGNVQTSISNLIDNASSAIVNLINGLGNLTLKEIFQAFLTLILVVTDVILKVMNALVYLISGKDAGDWVLQANSAIHTYGDQLLAQAGSTYQDITHKSLGELATSIKDYSHHVRDELVAVMSSMSTPGGAESVLSGSGGDVSYLSAENVDTIATAVQTALTL